MCKFSRGRLACPVPVQAFLMGTQPPPRSQGTEEGGRGGGPAAWHSVERLLWKKNLQVPLKCCVLHATKDSCYLLTYTNVTPASQSAELRLSDTLPLATLDGQSHCNEAASPPPPKGMCFAFAPRRFRGGALGGFFLLGGVSFAKAVLDKHRGGMGPCVTTEEASTNWQIL